MIFKDFAGKKLSMLGFGTMRLPTKDGEIDQEAVNEMTDYALANGVNYFDTAYFYHKHQSEVAVGKALARHPRESFYLADKYPGHMLKDNRNPGAIFEEQLKKCGVEYFDFYLLHNIDDRSVETYLDDKLGVLDYLKEQKRLGRIKHLGFSTHAGLPAFERFLDAVGKDMEFCQIQLNWLDWSLQDAKSKVELLNRLQIPIWVMEPVRGGRLCKLAAAAEAQLLALRPTETVPAWGFRYVQSVPGVTVVLSGMSNMAQMVENINTFSTVSPLTKVENATLMELAEGMKRAVPCTGCGYCTVNCPKELNVPLMIGAYNELCFDREAEITPLPAGKTPADCLGCGACLPACPQKIDVPTVLKNLAALLE